LGTVTNNKAEYNAVIAALKKAVQKFEKAQSVAV
jgi:ribonuclease HI